MRGSTRIGGTAIPLWLLVLAAIFASAGATVATVVAGQITGDMPTTVSQALVLDAETPGSCVTIETSTCNRHITSCSSDGTRFQIAVETYPGEYYEARLGIVNRSNQELFGLLTIDYPAEGFIVIVGESFDRVNDVTQLGTNQWKFHVESGAAGDRNNDGEIEDYLAIKVYLSAELKPGHYSLAGKITQVEY